VSRGILDELKIDTNARAALAEDYERFSGGLPRPFEAYALERFRLDLSSDYGGVRVKNPFGKGSGQLSLNTSQVRRDAEDGLGFVVLKTIIAEDAEGGQSMREWAIPETRMAVEPITGSNGEPGWTVTWKGRGWHDTIDRYLEFYREALDVGERAGMLVVPSCKYHLRRDGETEWRVGEYDYTTRRLLDVWASRRPAGANAAMPIEKDFSPTLAGSDRASQAELVLEWLTRVTGFIRDAAGTRPVSIGLKSFNAMFDDDFQLEMLRAVNERCEGGGLPDFLVYANRLFDPHREFEGVRGVAYGGPDLSARNLRVLARLRALERSGAIPPFRMPLSATGNICSGRIAAEYLLYGASTFQMHTYFQLPAREYRMPTGGKTERALHELYLNPETGLIAWLLHLRRAFAWPEEWNVARMAAAAATGDGRRAPVASASPVGVEIRPLGEADLPDAMRLKEVAGWNQTEADWRRLLTIEPEGCFAAVAGGRVVGTTTTIAYGRDLAWIGMVLVDPDWRRRGIATRLMRVALGYLEGRDVRTVKLDATPAGCPVYEALGFEVESMVERWELAARRPRPAPRDGASGVGVARLADGGLGERDGVLALDRRAFGADRTELLRALIDDACTAPLVTAGVGGDVEGYGLARRGARAAYVGSLVASGSAAAAALLDALLGSLDGEPIYVDVNTRFEGGTGLLADRGFVKQRDLIRMRRGGQSAAGTSDLVFAIAGPEVG
jgi:ribosomal protein S18 acetylase RimI-like enzyme